MQSTSGSLISLQEIGLSKLIFSQMSWVYFLSFISTSNPCTSTEKNLGMFTLNYDQANRFWKSVSTHVFYNQNTKQIDQNIKSIGAGNSKQKTNSMSFTDLSTPLANFQRVREKLGGLSVYFVRFIKRKIGVNRCKTQY